MLRPSRAEVGSQENVTGATVQTIGKLLADLVESFNDVGLVLTLTHDECEVSVFNLLVTVNLQREFRIAPELGPHTLANLRQERLQC